MAKTIITSIVTDCHTETLACRAASTAQHQAVWEKHYLCEQPLLMLMVCLKTRNKSKEMKAEVVVTVSSNNNPHHIMALIFELANIQNIVQDMETTFQRKNKNEKEATTSLYQITETTNIQGLHLNRKSGRDWKFQQKSWQACKTVEWR